MPDDVETASARSPYDSETRGGDEPREWQVKPAPKNPDGSVFDGGFVMAQPGDPNPPDDFVMAGSDE